MKRIWKMTLLLTLLITIFGTFHSNPAEARRYNFWRELQEDVRRDAEREIRESIRDQMRHQRDMERDRLNHQRRLQRDRLNYERDVIKDRLDYDRQVARNEYRNSYGNNCGNSVVRLSKNKEKGIALLRENAPSPGVYEIAVSDVSVINGIVTMCNDELIPYKFLDYIKDSKGNKRGIIVERLV